jgi:NTP pyrophosphatase (non-canonical NTP hydrolase)
MNFEEYQTRSHTTSLNTQIGDSSIVYPILGLTNEAGEVAGKLKKLFRDKNGIIDQDFKNMMIGELGDVLWYLSETCTQLGIKLSDIAVANIDKLESRKDRGVIKGSGDNR